MVYDKIKDMKYLDCFFHESMRYFAPANGIFFREALEDHYLADIQVKKGTLIFLSTFGNNYNPDNF